MTKAELDAIEKRVKAIEEDGTPYEDEWACEGINFVIQHGADLVVRVRELEEELRAKTTNEVSSANGTDYYVSKAAILEKRVLDLEKLLARASDEMKMIWDKDCGSVYDITLRIEIKEALKR